ncbi:hypothetical protein LCGC14_0726920 [marine sediment metagenome]|uniref:Uncharacterized protein n=1 Tax=marine sediment metagenome TaxID=412755 RepID=A0A0F9TI10_9ZZZZ
MSDLAIPAYVGSAGPGDFIEAPSGHTTTFSRGEFAKLDAGDNDLVEVIGDETDANIYGICEKDERNSKVLVFTGKDVKVPLAPAAATPAFGDIVYLASTTTVTGPTEATAVQKAIGIVVEMIGNGVVFTTHWHRDRTPIDKA